MLNMTPIYLLVSTAFFVNALSASTCKFYGFKAEPTTECEVFVTILNAIFVLLLAIMLIVEYKPEWLYFD